MRPNLSLSLFFSAFVAVLFWCSAGGAAEDVVIRIEAIPEKPWVGQKVVLQLDVLGKDGWAQLKKVDRTEVQGGYLKRFESQGTRLNETIDGGSYTGQRYEFLFFPQHSGTLAIDSVDIDVEVKRWGDEAANEVVRQTIPALSLEVRAVDGVPAEQGIISTPSFTATQTWEPDGTEIKAGDAVSRKIVLTARDLSGMVLPALDGGRIDGVGVYPASPRVDDSYARGDLTGTRMESITYVMEQPGTHEVPEFTVSWWNLDTETVETVTLEGKTFSVEAVPGADRAQSTGGASEKQTRSVLVPSIIVALLGLAMAGFWRMRSAAISWYRAWKKRRHEREKSYFKRVAVASASGDPLILMNEALQWLDRINEGRRPARLDEFVAKYGDSSDVQCVEEYSALGPEKPDSRQMQRFYDTLAAVRRNWLASRKELRSRHKASRLLPEIGIDHRR